MERYQRIYLDDNKLYVPEAGIVICAQAILKDNKINKVIAQVKFQNTLDKEIVALFVNVDCYDITEKKLEGVTNYQFLDLKEKRDSYFGSKTAITLPDNNTRRISVSVQKLVYDDGTVWEKGRTEDYMLLTEPEVISKDKEVCKQAQLEFGSAAQYKYQKYEELWRCSCGAINHNSEKNCHSCGLGEDKLIATSLSMLVERKNQRVAEEIRVAQEEEKARAILEEEQRKKNKKIALVALGVGVIVLTIFVIIATKPARTIARAEKYAEEGEYVLALKTLKDLNMPEETQETYYEISNLFKGEIDKAIDNKEINKAISLLESYPELDDYDELYESVRNACPHEEKKTDSKEVTCTENGYENQICKVCGKIFDEKVIEALGHNYSVNVKKEATCTEDGTGHMVCKVCNYEEDQVISKLGHNYDKKEIVSATCDKKGKQECTCKVCGHKYTEEISAKGHNWSGATCTKDGVCTTCGNVKEKAYGHTWLKDYSSDSGIVCKSCNVKYPVSATLKTYGFPYSDNHIRVDSMRIVSVKAYEEDEAFFTCTISGYIYDWVGQLYVEVVDQNGTPVLDEWGLSRDSVVDIASNTGNFTSWEFYVETPISGTYYVKIKYVM